MKGRGEAVSLPDMSMDQPLCRAPTPSPCLLHSWAWCSPCGTGENFGVEYLYRQSGLELLTDPDDLSRDIDEGFEDFEE